MVKEIHIQSKAVTIIAFDRSKLYNNKVSFIALPQQLHPCLNITNYSFNEGAILLSSADTTKQLERQATQLDKITIMLHSIQQDMKSTKGQSKLINQLQSQIKQLRTQMSHIQKKIAKRNFTTATISSRKKMLRPKKR